MSDKAELLPLAQALASFRVEILSTGGTAALLAKAGVPVTEISEHTGFPEIMGGRVKTLHPKVHGGILGRRGEDDAVMAEHAISAIDLVVVNLYPFEQTIAQPNCLPEQAIEQIDIGGPAMLRAAAKNHRDVAIVTEPGDYPAIIEELQRTGGALSLTTRQRLAAQAFAHSAAYDSAIAHYLSNLEWNSEGLFPQQLNLHFLRVAQLRYGENPHQQAAVYRERSAPANGVVSAKQLQGKTLSYNNLADSDAAWQCVQQFNKPSCVIVKHANPCGVATAKHNLSAYEAAYRTDPNSAFGGIIAFNQELDAHTSKAIIDRQFVEVIIAPRVAPEALQVLQQKPNLRVLETDSENNHNSGLHFQRVTAGLLVQQYDHDSVTEHTLDTVSKCQPTDAQLEDLLFAWRVAMFVKSNAIVYARQGATIGIGAGQMSRVYSAKLAELKANDEGLNVAGAVMASDAFFPFRDAVDAAAAAGISAIIQPGGSVRDKEVIAAADEHEIAMVFTNCRHFRH